MTAVKKNCNRAVDLRNAFSLSESALLMGIASAVAGGAHSIYAPSSSKRWLACPGSLIPSVLAPDESGYDAAYGTVGHAIAEQWLNTGIDPTDDLVGRTQYVQSGEWGYMIDIDSEMLTYVREYVNACLLLPGDHFVEVKSDFSQWMPIPHQRGTSDHVALSPGLGIITDLKLGANVYVPAPFNSQLMIYALGVYAKWGKQYAIEKFILRIFQPRMNNYDEWEISVKDLLEFGEYVRERALIAWQIDAPRIPSKDACQYCPVANTCAANVIVQFKVMRNYPFDLGSPVQAAEYDELREFLAASVEEWRAGFADPATLTTEELAKINTASPLATRFWKGVDTEIQLREKKGDVIPFHKYVVGRAMRFFRKSKEAQKSLENVLPHDKIWTRKMISPAKAEALMREAGYSTDDVRDVIAPLVERREGRKLLVPNTDPRKSVDDILGSAFDD